MSTPSNVTGQVSWVGGVPTAGGGLVGGETFAIDRANAPALIERLTAIRDELVDIDTAARQTADDRTPPGTDGYSAVAVGRICRQASDDDGCHGRANLLFQLAVQTVIDNLWASLAQYDEAEGTAAASLRQQTESS